MRGRKGTWRRYKAWANRCLDERVGNDDLFAVRRGRIAREGSLDVRGQDLPDGWEFPEEFADQLMGHGPRVRLSGDLFVGAVSAAQGLVEFVF